MNYCKVVAIVRRSVLPTVEKRLIQEQVPGITVTPVKGYGEYANYFGKDLMVPHVRIEIFVPESKVQSLVSAIVDTAHTGGQGDGFVGVIPVSEVVRIRTGKAPECDPL
jgi:nitrogen regulatory protein P-II 1